MGNCQSQNSANQVSNPSQFSGIRLTCRSWLKTYNNLFDYVTKSDIDTVHLMVNDSTRIIKNQKKYKVVRIDQKLPISGVDSALDLIDNKDGSFLYRSWTSGQQNGKLIRHLPWLVVKSIPSGKYAIKQGDIIRLGKQKVKVKEIIMKDKQEQDEFDDNIIAKYRIYNDLTKEAAHHSHQSDESSEVRGEPNNPLICPCKCTGSAKYIHLTCIQQWLTKSINPRQVNMATIITWKPLICQLCNTNLPFKIYLDGKKYFTVKIPRPKKPYMVLNPVYRDQSKVKVYYLISFATKKQQIMGRKNDCDVKITDDASVSRYHTVFEYAEANNKGKFYIKDNNSKYGTLIYLKKNLLIKPSLSGVCLQIGGDLIQFQFNSSLIKSLKMVMDQIQLINQSESTSSQGQQSEEGEIPVNDLQPNQQQNEQRQSNQNNAVIQSHNENQSNSAPNQLI